MVDEVKKLVDTRTEAARRQDAFLAGVLAGGLSIAGTHWLDVLKVQKQGITPAITSQSLRTGVTYLGFDQLKSMFRDHGKTGWFWEFVAGTLGAAVGEALTNPFTVWKNAAIKNQALTTMSIPAYLMRTSGLRSLTRGILPATMRKSVSNGGLLSSGPYCVQAVQSVVCTIAPTYSEHSYTKIFSKLVGGGFAGAVMEVATIPLDKWKVYAQAVINPQTNTLYTTHAAFVQVLKQGPAAWFAGSSHAFSRKFAIKAIQYFALIELADFFMNRSILLQNERQSTAPTPPFLNIPIPPTLGTMGYPHPFDPHAVVAGIYMNILS
eukprot:gene3344-3841_t